MFSITNNDPKKEVCRLCYYETSDTVDIFSEKGIAFDYEGKINKYLYLYVAADDDLPKTVCWMCTQHLETFHKFYEKINEIQKSTLKTAYEKTVLRPTYEVVQTIDSVSASKNVAVVDEESNLIEVLFVSDEYEAKDEDETEEFELLEIDNSESNLQSETIDGQVENQIIVCSHSDNNALNHNANEIVEQNKEQIDAFTCVAGANQQPEMIYQRTRQRNKDKAFAQLETAKTKPSSAKNNLRHSMRNVKPVQIEKEAINTQIVRKSLRQSKITQDSNKKKIATQISSTKSSESIKVENNVEQDEAIEGTSGDEFPARDSDNEDWPAQQTLDEFPKDVIRNGLLLVKGKQLMSMICRFYKLECGLCDEKLRFKQLKELFDHYTALHDTSGYVECCQTKLVRYPSIIMHMARHLQPDAFKCDECGYMVTRPRFLEIHKQTHLPEDQKPYACDQCSRRFCWKGALRIHSISHQPVDERQLYVCHICGKAYDTPGGLSTHKKLIHSGKKLNESNVCHLCAKNFATRTGLYEHMVTIHQPREKGQVQCSECGKWLMNNRCLKSHMILHSNAEFHCDQCDYTTKKKVLLNRHMITQHSDEKPFTCNLCGRAFKLKRGLTVHMEQHGAAKTYKCQFCDRKFNSSTNFYTHRKNSHPEQLQELKCRKQEELRQKRIKAGVEQEDSEDVVDVAESEMTLSMVDDREAKITVIQTKPTDLCTDFDDDEMFGH